MDNEKDDLSLESTLAMAQSSYLSNVGVYSALIGKLSSRAKSRVLQMMVQYPFNDKEYKSTSAIEKSCLAFGLKALEAKFLMEMNGYLSAAGKALTDETEMKYNDKIEEINGESK